MICVRSCASLSALVTVVLTLSVAAQGSLSIVPNNQSSDTFFGLKPSNPQSLSSLNSSFTPSIPPSFADNASALVEVGLDVNRPITWTAGASGNVIGIQCRPEFGRNLDIRDCIDAWRWSPHDTAQLTFAMRHTIHHSDIALPWRTMGCASSSDQQACIMQPNSIDANVIMQQEGYVP